jgi:MFS transporter, DHA3 family, macrolide efflux protein
MRILAPLRDPPVALLWGGLSLSAIGDQLYAVALTWIAVGVFGAVAGYLSALGAGCVLATALIAGRWTDAWSERVTMIGADLARAVALIAVVFDWSSHGRPTAAALVLATIVLAAGQAIFQPALQGLLPVLVGNPSRLPAANAILDSTGRIARLLGPGLVAIFAAWIPAKHFLSLDAASFGLSAASVLLIGRMRRLPLAPDQAPRNVLASALRGFRAVSGHPLLCMDLLIAGVSNGVWYAVMFLGLPLAIARYAPGNFGLGAYGFVISTYGCMNLASTLVVGSREMPANPARMMFSGFVVLGAGFLMMTLATVVSFSPPMIVGGLAIGAAVGGIGGPLYDIPVAVLRQTKLPRVDIPAAMRAKLVATYGGLFVTMLFAPLLYTALPVACVMGGCAGVALAIGVVGIIRFASLSRSPSNPKPKAITS